MTNTMLPLVAIPDDWLQDILIHIDFIRRQSLRRCCRKWPRLLNSKLFCQTVLLEGLLTCSTGQQDDYFRYKPEMCAAISPLKMALGVVIFTGQIIAFPPWSGQLDLSNDIGYQRQLHGWVYTSMLFLSPWSRYEPVIPQKIQLIYHNIPHVPWTILQIGWASPSLSRIEMNNITIALADLWSRTRIGWVFPMVIGDAWMEVQFAKLEKFLSCIHVADWKCETQDATSMASLNRLLLNIVPKPNAEIMDALKAGLQRIAVKKVHEIYGCSSFGLRDWPAKHGCNGAGDGDVVPDLMPEPRTSGAWQ